MIRSSFLSSFKNTFRTVLNTPPQNKRIRLNDSKAKMEIMSNSVFWITI